MYVADTSKRPQHLANGHRECQEEQLITAMFTEFGGQVEAVIGTSTPNHWTRPAATCTACFLRSNPPPSSCLTDWPKSCIVAFYFLVDLHVHTHVHVIADLQRGWIILCVRTGIYIYMYTSPQG